MAALSWAFLSFTGIGGYLGDIVSNGGRLPQREVDAIPLGDAFTHGDVSASSGWRLGTDARGRLGVEDVRLTNDGDVAQRLGVLLFVYDGDEPLGTSSCRTAALVEPGDTAAARCWGNDLGGAGDADGVTTADPLDF